MTTYDPQREARSHRARAGAYTKAAEREAREAAEAYAMAARMRRHAAKLTQTPALSYGNYTPANLEVSAATWEHVGDTWLRASFHDTAMAATYRELGVTCAAHAQPS